MNSGSDDPIEDDELLYRRIPKSTGWYDKATGELNPQAFGPHKERDTTGLSVARAKYKSNEEAARGMPGKSYFVAVMCAGELRQQGIDVVPRPDFPDGAYDRAHAEIPDLNSETRKDTQTLERQRILATQLTLRVEGPFPTAAEE